MTSKTELFTTNTGQKLKVHLKENCRGDKCVIHNPSNHHMKDWPLRWREDRGIFERICKCGVGHPDPDCRSAKGQFGIHGCCGCCNLTEKT